MHKLQMLKMSYQRRKAWTGILFLTPWIIGVIFLFIKPFIETIIYSFNELEITTQGFSKTFIGFENYSRALFEDPFYLRTLVISAGNMLYQSPVIVIFSLLIACILNQKFRGRLLVRAVFFLPVIIASGVVIGLLREDPLSYVLRSGGSSSVLFRTFSFTELLLDIGINHSLVFFFTDFAGNVFDLSWKAGIQILLCLAGLQTISKQLYEAARIEGANAWEAFWKITIPGISPILLVCLIFTITESFTDYSNGVMKLIYGQISNHQDFQYSAAMALLYFLVVFITVIIVYVFTDRVIVYTEE